jgi:hypothetical protein
LYLLHLLSAVAAAAIFCTTMISILCPCCQWIWS